MNESREESEKLPFLFDSLDGVHVRWIFVCLALAFRFFDSGTAFLVVFYLFDYTPLHWDGSFLSIEGLC